MCHFAYLMIALYNYSLSISTAGKITPKRAKILSAKISQILRLIAFNRTTEESLGGNKNKVEKYYKATDVSKMSHLYYDIQT